MNNAWWLTFHTRRARVIWVSSRTSLHLCACFWIYKQCEIYLERSLNWLFRHRFLLNSTAQELPFTSVIFHTWWVSSNGPVWSQLMEDCVWDLLHCFPYCRLIELHLKETFDLIHLAVAIYHICLVSFKAVLLAALWVIPCDSSKTEKLLPSENLYQCLNNLSFSLVGVRHYSDVRCTYV